ncbi:hypothetical protein DFH29DRAFT_477313 [Suillus ampliporus]|nr:hypothetical protein DFH29DRAFT_477313 [Suillus ampliporus]
MSYQSTPNGWGNNQVSRLPEHWQSRKPREEFQFGPPSPIQFQPQPSWGGIDYFRAYAPNIDPMIFNQVYSNISGAGTGITPVGTGANEARVWHQRTYGSLCAIKALTPQEIGYASAYEAYRIWIHNNVLYEPLGAEPERQREAFIGLAVAEASRMYMITHTADAYGRVPACEAAAATASLIFDQNLTGSVGGYMGAGMQRGTGMGAGAHGSGFGTPGTAGASMVDGTDPYAIDYEAPYFRQRMGRRRRLSSPGGTYGAIGAYNPGAERGRSGMVGSPYLGTAAGMGMGASPAMYSAGSSARSPLPPGGNGMGASPAMYSAGSSARSPLLPGGNGMGATGMYGGAYHGHGSGSPVYGGASPIQAPSMYGASPAYADTRNVTTVTAYPGTTTVIELPRRRHRSSSRHHHRRARSAEPVFTTNTGTMGGHASNNFRDAAGGAANAVGGAIGGIAGGAAGLVGGAVGGLTRGAIGGFTAGASPGAMGGAFGTYGPAGASGSSGSPNMNHGYPGYRGMYRY